MLFEKGFQDLLWIRKLEGSRVKMLHLVSFSTLMQSLVCFVILCESGTIDDQLAKKSER